MSDKKKTGRVAYLHIKSEELFFMKTVSKIVLSVAVFVAVSMASSHSEAARLTANRNPSINQPSRQKAPSRPTPNKPTPSNPKKTIRR